jgi:hypothetical protein
MISERFRSPRQAGWLVLAVGLGLISALLTAAEGTRASDPPEALIQNASFESLIRLAAPPAGNATGAWVLKSDQQAPAVWTLSGAYPGTLEVHEDGAADGQRFLRLAAGPQRAAHLAQPCPGLRGGLRYEVSLRYRGGPVEMKVYEYTAEGKLKADRAFAKGPATPVRAGPWGVLESVYALPPGIANANLVVCVPAGAEADVDDLRIRRFAASDSVLNVRSFGASGSGYETTATTSAGAKTVVLKELGDFEVGQQVALSTCNPHLCDGLIWEPTKWSVPMAGTVEARGYDGSLGNWTVYILDFAGTTPPTFRWTDDLGLTWKQTKVPVTGDWQALNGGVEVKLGGRDWSKPCLVTFSGRDQLISTIMAIEGKTLTLADAAPLGAPACKIQHTDSGPLQAAFDRAVAEGRNLFIPSGCYRLTAGLELKGADGITVEGESEERTILDIGNGTGACISVVGGSSVTLRNLRFRGFSGFAERRQMGALGLPGYPEMWGFYVKHCNAVGIRSPERLLVENCHASRMSAECFYSGSRSRSGNDDPATYTKSIVYQYCTVTDCARNAFNNNDMAENTSVLYCRIQEVGGCTWEGASRFVKFVGNYVRNAGTVAIGNIRSRAAAFDILPSGQHIVAHNTFEQEMVYGGCAVRSSAGSTPVVISNNIFVNFNTSAIEATGFGDASNLPAGNTLITGNAIDLTCVRGDSRARIGIAVSADDATLSDNQIYVRGEVDARVKGIVLQEPAQNLVVHDNIVRGCGTGLAASTLSGRVEKVLDARTFRSGGALPWPRRRTHEYRAWRIAWTGRNGTVVPGPEIERFDAEEGVFRLAADTDLTGKTGFCVYPPQGPQWNLHHNTFTNCTQPVTLDVFGGPTAAFADNLLSRGQATGIKAALEVRGAFRLSDNQFAGFDEPDSTALLLHPSRFGGAARFICRHNSFDRCPLPIAESTAGVWAATLKEGNLVAGQAGWEELGTGDGLVRTLPPSAGPVSLLSCTRLAQAPAIDGQLADWSWNAADAVASLNRTHEGGPSQGFTGRARAGYDSEALYLALDIVLPKGEAIAPQDGIEWSFQSNDERQPTPIFVLWGSADGSLNSLTAMGASADQATKLREATRYALATSATGWTCEWRVPWGALGVTAATPPAAWAMNIGVRSSVHDCWLVWAPTGGRICNVQDAGELRLAK